MTPTKSQTLLNHRRTDIEADTQAFLAAGGKIQRPGVTDSVEPYTIKPKTKGRQGGKRKAA